MRGLNLLKDARHRKQLWRKHQQTQIDALGVPDLQVAFPGSLMCNHILVPVETNPASWKNKIQLPDVSSVVYGFCSSTERSSMFKDSLVIDIDGDTANDPIISVIAEHAAKGKVKRVVVLGESAYSVYADLIRLQLSVEVDVYEPDWISPLSLYSVYRQASSVLFVNTMRVIDAACTGCACVLIADDVFQKQPAFGMLQSYLSSVGCGVYTACGKRISMAEAGLNNSYLVVENSDIALDKALKQRLTTEEVHEDWLIELDLEEPLPIITPYHFPIRKLLWGLRDRKTGIARKFTKLCDDPGAFFADSNLRALRIIGQLLTNSAVNR